MKPIGLIAGVLIITIAGTAQGEVALTVYKSFAMVKDVRTLELERGTQTVRLDDVAATLDPTSVHFNALDRPGSVQVLEQNYLYDVADAGRLLEKYLGQSVTVTLEDGAERVGTLLSVDGGSLVLGTADATGASILSRDQVRDVQLGDLPGGLVVRPTLLWTLDSERAGSQRCEVSYLAEQVSWHAEYVAVANEDDTRLELDAWVSLDNRSGASYENATLKLVAGDVRRVQDVPEMRFREEAVMSARAADAGFQEESFFEYHLYTLPRPATVADRETKQLTLFPGTEAGVEKKYVYQGQRHPSDVQIQLEFENSEKNGLGLPLPAGKVRVFKEDGSGALQFVGEDRIDHTPKNEELSLYLGNAFDLVGERTLADQQRIGDRGRQESVKVEIRNRKDKGDVTVEIEERLYGEWTITDKSQDFEKRDATTAVFTLTVPAGESRSITYTVRMRY